VLAGALDGYGLYPVDAKKQVNQSIRDNRRLDTDEITF
jgi:hypothetical protein